MTIIKETTGNIYLNIYIENPAESGIRINVSESRYSKKVLREFYDLIKVLEEELASDECHPDLLSIN